MPDNALTSLNWLDLPMFILIAGMLFYGASKGFVLEFFRIIGILLATVLSLHFYVFCAEYLKQVVSMPVWIGQVVCYILIVVFVIVLFYFIGQGWQVILKLEAKSVFSRWGGVILAFFSSLFLCSLLFFGILLVGNQTLNKFAKNSITGYYLIDLSPNIYKAAHQGLIVPFFPDEQLNRKVFENL